MTRKMVAAAASLSLVAGGFGYTANSLLAEDFDYVSSGSGSISSGSLGTAIATCPTGTKVVSGGFQLTQYSGVKVVMSAPGNGSVPTTWFVQARNDNLTSADEVIAYAICSPA